MIKGLKRASGKSINFKDGFENHIYYDKHNNIVWCNHEKSGYFTLYNNAMFVMKSSKHITMREIVNAITTKLRKKYFIKVIMKANMNNNVYCGNVMESIYGKNFTCIENIGSHATESNFIVKFDSEKALKSGFSTIQEAKNSLVWRSAENENSLWELISMEVIEINL